jgi:hypothetical protein
MYDLWVGSFICKKYLRLVVLMVFKFCNFVKISVRGPLG